MNNSSMGYHTFSVSQKMNAVNFSFVTNDFIRYANSNNDVVRFPIDSSRKKWKYTYKKFKGITWLLSSGTTSNGFSIYSVTAVINPKVIIENNYISAAQADDLKTIEGVFNEEIKKISPLLYEMKYWSVNRVDYCLNIDLNELELPCTPEQMMTLIKRGNIPKGYEEYEVYDKISHRKITDKNSFYLKSKSVVINFYWKYAAQDVKHPNYSNRELSHDVIRLEVQCKYQKVYSLSKKYPYDGEDNIVDIWEMDKFFSSIFIHSMVSSTVSESVICDNVDKVLRKGDYFNLETACDIVRSWNFRKEKERRLLSALIFINEKRGISKARAALDDIETNDFERSLRDLDELLVNPVTIPRNWGIKHIPNLLRAYNKKAKKEILSADDINAKKHIENILKY